jgi:hypothetical protein
MSNDERMSNAQMSNTKQKRCSPFFFVIRNSSFFGHSSLVIHSSLATKMGFPEIPTKKGSRANPDNHLSHSYPNRTAIPWEATISNLCANHLRLLGGS